MQAIQLYSLQASFWIYIIVLEVCEEYYKWSPFLKVFTGNLIEVYYKWGPSVVFQGTWCQGITLNITVFWCIFIFREHISLLC